MIADSHWHRIEELFEGALSQPGTKRAEWLRQACPDDEMRGEVERMLEAHDRPGGILDRRGSVEGAAAAAAAAAPRRSAELVRQLSGSLGDRYTIEHELGRGGTATVYLAHERKHARPVVLKVLKPDVAARWGAERFVREVQIAARLAHPHILGLIDSGEAGDTLYYVMPYVEGETLRRRLDRRGAFPAVEALVLLRDIADALAYAHRAGVVHRDLKPENVLCAGDHAFLMDFGVAKLLTPVAGHERLTQYGASVGTPAYMAPEQLAADPQVDQRADIYAWGLIANEMHTGRLPDDAILGRASTISEALARRRPETPPPLVELVGQCLADNPAERLGDAALMLERLTSLTTPTPAGPTPARQIATMLAGAAATAAPLAAATRRSSAWVRARARRAFAGGALAVVAVLALAGVGAAVWMGWSRYRARGAAGGGKAISPIAVAAFSNETGDPRLDSWGRMAGDWVTQGLDETGLVTVVPWPTALQASERVRAEHAAGRPVNDAAMMSEETGARTVVTGSYYLVGDSIQFRVQVTDARGSRTLGAPPPVGAPRDSAHQAVRALRNRMMSAVAILSDDRLTGLPELSRRPPTFEAYQAFDRGLQLFLDQEYTASAPEFRQAFALDSSFSVALLYAGNAYWNMGRWDSLDVVLRLARARRGELSEYDRAWQEFLEQRLAGNGDRALLAIRRAAESAAGSRALYAYAQLANYTDRPREALDALRRLDPDRGAMRGWSSYYTELTHALHLLGEHERELAAARQLRARFPERRVGLSLEVRALGALGRAAVIDSLITAALPLSPADYWSQGAAMVIAGEELMAHGRQAEGTAYLRRAVAWLDAQLGMAPTDRSHRYWMGSALYDLGRYAEAAPHFEGIARDYPERIQFRGLVAVTAARLGATTAEAEARLGPSAPHERGEHTAWRARIAAVRGDARSAASLFAEAIRLGVTGLPWWHATAHNDLVLLRDVRGSLPGALK